MPSGPRSRLLTTFEVARKPYLAMAKARQRYGDPFSMTTINGQVVVTAEPELIREIFTTKDTKDHEGLRIYPLCSFESFVVCYFC